MRHARSTSANLSAAEFFELVDAQLTPPMAALGFHRLVEGVNTQPDSQSSNSRRPVHGGRDGASHLWFELGYEAGGDQVRRLLNPEDPENEDEWWVHYEPTTGTLELSDWEPVADASVDWDVCSDVGPCSPEEVRRRLERLGTAIRSFVAERGG